ncbi:polysaccharide biosynthesis/export family protein [Paraglaciecola aquimarina]|uniref:Polysaccharide biosynthesis/export family protein n=1 Tax=Paraglaciecola aquimarina TaxID=1235557 RepID=A0ABU3T1G7_9ALTE|nr:polysaccharide biosynthesis/export family protein [Paraglaciecola aquimarina]MDU0356125.1 polysaccharide biosynthesis/export family protein [Paraglaciecola aquimarina]
MLWGYGDSINIRLFGKETGEFELFVNNEGVIQIPNLGTMSAVGLTYQQLKTQLTEKYNQQVIGVTPIFLWASCALSKFIWSVKLIAQVYSPLTHCPLSLMPCSQAAGSIQLALYVILN